MRTERPPRCALCRSEKRAQIDQDLLAALPYREIAERHGLDKMAVWRHSKHLDKAGLPENAEPDFNAAIIAARMALARAQRRSDVRGMGAALELLQGLLRFKSGGSGTAAPEGSDGLSSVSDFHLAQRRKEYLQIIRQASSTDDLLQEIADIQKILEMRASEAVSDGDITGTKIEDELQEPYKSVD